LIVQSPAVGPATLANGGTDLAPYHEFDDDVPQALKEEVDQLRLDVIGGVVVPGQ